MRSLLVRLFGLPGCAFALAIVPAGVSGVLVAGPGQAVAAEADSASAYVDFLVSRADALLDDGPERDPATAATLLRQAVQVGSTSAMLSLADLYAEGDGVDRSFDQAKTLIEGALEAGATLSAWVAMGDLYRDAEVPHRDAAKALEAYQQAADLGAIDAMVKLARMVGFGEGVPVDFARAKAMLGAAISAGDVNYTMSAWASLGELYRRAEGADHNPTLAVEAYQNAVDLGDIGSIVRLARMIAAGDGVPVDFERARLLLETAVTVEGGDKAWGYATLGDLYRDADAANRDATKALEAYQQAADLGDIGALIKVARMVGFGEGVPVDFERARTALEGAIATGDVAHTASAWASLGELYRRAAGADRDPTLAVEAYQNAVDLGDTSSIIRLARMVAIGDGVPVDFHRARVLLEQAVTADGGDKAWAFATLGDLYRDADAANRDPAKALDAYQQAADLGDAGAMVKVARMAGFGEGVPVDFERARTALEAAIAAGDASYAASAWANLGDLYRRAEGADRNSAKAVEAYQTAVDLGDNGSIVRLARMIATGDGAPVDFQRARLLLEKAVTVEDSDKAWGYASLGDLYRDADPLNRDPARALDAYQQAADLGDVGSMVKLARMVGFGEGVPVDLPRAKGALEGAIAAGDADSAASAWASLGELYRRAGGADYDPGLAVEAYQHAVDLGDVGSIVRLARMVGTGEGVPADFDRARILLEKAVTVEGGDKAWAYATLGDLYRDAAEEHRDAAKALDAYQQAADLGDIGAMVGVARMVGFGEGVPVDFARAKAALEEAIAAGDADYTVSAWASLGELYRRAEGADRDPARAVEAYRNAVDLGDTGSIVRLARMIASGDGVAANLGEAKALLERAAAIGGDEAVSAWIDLADMHADPSGAFHDSQLALDYYRKAAAAGSGEAHLAAARLETAEGITTADQRQVVVEHYVQAAQLMDAETVAREMYRLEPTMLYVAVQTLLSRVDRPIGVDGIFGPRMQSAIDRFCEIHTIDTCGKGIVSFDLLIGLLHPQSQES